MRVLLRSELRCPQNEAKEEVEEAQKELAAAQKAIRVCDEGSEEPCGRKRLQKRNSSAAELGEDSSGMQEAIVRQQNCSMVLSDDDDDDDMRAKQK